MSKIVQDVFTVVSKNFVTPNYIRVVLTGNVSLFKGATLGDNNKIFIPPKGMKKVHMRSYIEETNEWILPELAVRPFMRTYTNRAINFETNELVLEFANHGEEGPASAWANAAQIGDELGVAMKISGKQLFPEVSNYLLVGDATAIPALSVILENLPSTAKGNCIIEVKTEEDKQSLKTKADINFKWIYNENPGDGNALFEAVKAVELPETSKFGFVACEFATVKQIRTYLRKEKQWEQNELFAYSYWKKGMAENESAKDRQKEKAN
ncbi:siderophore-interacting protein [Neotamlana laminarinivorans]|uniref:Siderophore-interacting protein n=1 Tax=Neotamlana laminarinivorans TaxID=2883124 RepID=A0A9X1L618_9FLAO|nr:siderophore-interacting protein [Tamlana laminarinivorans]MCB4800021.1 siderophore-interacting protein [Tamlana laminarinivorans]